MNISHHMETFSNLKVVGRSQKIWNLKTTTCKKTQVHFVEKKTASLPRAGELPLHNVAIGKALNLMRCRLTVGACHDQHTNYMYRSLVKFPRLFLLGSCPFTSK